MPGLASSEGERLLHKNFVFVRPWFETPRTANLFHAQSILQMHDPEALKKVGVSRNLESDFSE